MQGTQVGAAGVGHTDEATSAEHAGGMQVQGMQVGLQGKSIQVRLKVQGL